MKGPWRYGPTPRESATYFLVWHIGMSITDADSAIDANTSCVKPLARAGEYEFLRAANALRDYIERAEK